MAYLVTKFI
jgi:hypothetical protein